MGRYGLSRIEPSHAGFNPLKHPRLPTKERRGREKKGEGREGGRGESEAEGMEGG